MKKSVKEKMKKALAPANGKLELQQLAGNESLFVEKGELALPKSAVVASMSPMMKPDKFPVGKTLVGRLKKLFETTPSKGKRGTGIEIVPDGMPIGIALPVVMTIRQGLELTGEGTDAKTPAMGKVCYIEKMPERLPSKKGQAAWHFVVAYDPES